MSTVVLFYLVKAQSTEKVKFEQKLEGNSENYSSMLSQSDSKIMGEVQTMTYVSEKQLKVNKK